MAAAYLAIAFVGFIAMFTVCVSEPAQWNEDLYRSAFIFLYCVTAFSICNMLFLLEWGQLLWIVGLMIGVYFGGRSR